MGRLSRFKPILPGLWFFSAAVLVMVAGQAVLNRQKTSGVPDRPFTAITDSSAPAGYTKQEIAGRETPYFDLKPETTGLFGILPKQVFDLTTKEPTDSQTINQYLQTNVPVTVRQISPTVFRLEPQTALGHDRILNISLAVKNIARADGRTWDRDYSWSFQTQGKFRVISSLPGDQKTEVPLITGIELVFSQDDYQDPTPFISITPAIRYRTERHGETLALVPEQPLNPKTVYTVTLKKGLSPQSRDDRITEDYVFSFQTGEAEKIRYRLSAPDSFVQVTPEDTPVIKINSYSQAADPAIKTRVYKFRSAADFITSRFDQDQRQANWYTCYQEDTPVDVSGLSLVAEADSVVGRQEYLEFIQLPSSMPEGLYLVQFWYEAGQKLEQIWLQSSPLSGYMTVGREQTLVWVNDLQTKSPVANALVSVAGSAGGYYTGSDGITVFSTPQIFHDSLAHYLQITAGSRQLYLPVTSLKQYSDRETTIANDYWSYIYHERRLYRPDDEVYFWGVVKDRRTGSVPATVKAVIEKGYREDNVRVASRDIPVSADGTFTGSLTFSEIPADWYQLTIRLGDTVLSSSGFTVAEFEKPEMKIEVVADKKAVFAGEPVNFTGYLSFFDGTPVKQVALSVHETRSALTKTEKTDDQGRINYVYTPVFESQTSNNYYPYPRYEGIAVNPELADGGKVEGRGRIRVYGSGVMLTSDSRQDKNQAQIRAVINRVDLTAVNSGSGTDVKGSPVADARIQLAITKTWYESKQTGTYYDFVEKTTRPQYSFSRKSEILPEQTLVSDTTGEVGFDLQMEDHKSYLAVLTATDESGRQYRMSENFYYYKDGYNSRQEGTSPKLTLNKTDNRYSLNEQVEVGISQNGEIYPDTADTRFLFIVAAGGRQDYFVSGSPAQTFSFTAKYIPNATLGGVIFAGNHYIQVSGSCNDWYCGDYYYGYSFGGTDLLYRETDRQLELSIETDVPKYQPGDTATVTVKVSHHDQPVVGAEVNTVLVDQALVAMDAVRVPSPLAGIYRKLPNYIYYGYYSHKPPLPSSEAERGGGGDGEVREIFKDTAYFDTARTDAGGIATFKVKLPDNITSWLIYSQSVTSGLLAGHNENSLIVSKEFFVTNEAPRQYLSADRPNVTVTGYGSALKTGDVVDYETFLLIDGAELAKQTRSVPAFNEVAFPLPALGIGDYRLAAGGRLNKFADRVIYPLEVIDSRMAFKADKSYLLNGTDKLENPDIPGIKTNEPVKVMITDQGQGKYVSQLHRYCFPYSNRLEKWIATTVAKQILKEVFADTDCGGGNWEPEKFQTPDGGLAQVKWGGSLLETTVWAIRTDAGQFNREQLLSYLENQAEKNHSDKRQRLLALWGLIMLDQPRLNDLNRLIPGLSAPGDKLIAVLALISSDQTEKARQLYLDILADYAYTSKPYIRIEGTTNAGEIIENTAAAILAGAELAPEYNTGLAGYLRDYGWQAEDILLDLARISTIKDDINRLPDELTKLQITAPGINKTLDLSNKRKDTFWLQPDELSRFKAGIISGKAEIRFNYRLNASGFAAAEGRDDRLTISRTYEKAVGTGEIRPGDIVKVEIRANVAENAPTGTYEIIDYLPSGLVYLSNPWIYGLRTPVQMRLQDDRLVRGSFYFFPQWRISDTGSRIYYARAAFSGDYLAEPATFQSNTDLTIWQATPATRVKISPR